MKVDIKIDSSIDEPNAVINTPKLTPELISLVEIIEQSDSQPHLLVAKKDDKTFVIEPEHIELIRTEDGTVMLYNHVAEEFVIIKTLGELLDLLGTNFIRISKSAIVNINRIDHLEPSFGRSVYVAMKSGVSDYISKSYLSDFKKRLGL